MVHSDPGVSSSTVCPTFCVRCDCLVGAPVISQQNFLCLGPHKKVIPKKGSGKFQKCEREKKRIYHDIATIISHNNSEIPWAISWKYGDIVVDNQYQSTRTEILRTLSSELRRLGPRTSLIVKDDPHWTLRRSYKYSPRADHDSAAILNNWDLKQIRVLSLQKLEKHQASHAPEPLKRNAEVKLRSAAVTTIQVTLSSKNWTQKNPHVPHEPSNF